ncbi:MAG TPA: restriction endonuclease subunit S [Terriglobia bacterium]|nr:restriction endonuclease subunit S [Terriglobia bacterium]
MKMGWETKRLGDVCEIFMGQSPNGDSYNTTGEGVPLINGPVEFSEHSFGKTIRSKFTTRPTKFCKEGDLILCVRGSTTGRMNIAGFDACVGRGVAAIRAKQYQPWINHFISAKRDEIHGKGTGATFPNVSGATLADLRLVVPPLPEQQRIVGILDEAFEGIATAKANAEKNLQNARALFESHLNSVFTQRGKGWVEKRLEQIGTTQTGSTPKTAERDNYGDFIPFVKPADFNKDGSLDYDKDGLSKKGLARARNVAARSVLMVCIGATIGKCGYCDREIVTNQQINALTPFDGVFYKFIYYQMITENFQRRVLLSSGQATLPIINKSKWSALIVTLPQKIEDQKRIAKKLEAICEETQHLESIYQQKLAALEELKKSLLHQAFSGEL